MKPAWTPFQKATPENPVLVGKLAELARKHKEGRIREGAQWWRNSRYTVCERRFWLKNKQTGEEAIECVHLSIHDHDRTAEHDWRDYQRIKNEIIGEEEEAVELYPAESRLADTSNEFHLWCFVGVRLSIGFAERLVSDGGYYIGAKQRAWENGDRPKDCRDITREEVENYLATNGGSE